MLHLRLSAPGPEESETSGPLGLQLSSRSSTTSSPPVTTSLTGRTRSPALARLALSTSLPSGTTGTTPESRLPTLPSPPRRRFSDGSPLVRAVSPAVTMLAPSPRTVTCLSWMPTSPRHALITTRGQLSSTAASSKLTLTSPTRAGALRTLSPTELPPTDPPAISSPRTTISRICLRLTSPTRPLVRDLASASLSVSVLIVPLRIAQISSLSTQPSTSRHLRTTSRLMIPLWLPP